MELFGPPLPWHSPPLCDSGNFVASLPLDVTRRGLSLVGDGDDIEADSAFQHVIFSQSSLFDPVMHDFFSVLQVKGINEPMDSLHDNAMVVEVSATSMHSSIVLAR